MPDRLVAAPQNYRRAAFVDIADGHQLYVRDWGQGPPVVLLSGWAMDGSIWGATMTALNDHGLRTVTFDRRGHGRSTDPGGFEYDLLADDLDRVLSVLDLRDVVLVAHSGAAGEAIRYVARHGEARLSRLILVGATGPCMRRRPDNPSGFSDEAIEAVMRQLDEDLAGWIDANAEPFAPGATRRTLDWLAQMVLNTSPGLCSTSSARSSTLT